MTDDVLQVFVEFDGGVSVNSTFIEGEPAIQPMFSYRVEPWEMFEQKFGVSNETYYYSKPNEKVWSLNNLCPSVMRLLSLFCFAQFIAYLVAIAQWENECTSLSALSVARVMIAQWESECISMSAISVARMMVAQWDNKFSSLSSPWTGCHPGSWWSILRKFSLADHTLPTRPEPA